MQDLLITTIPSLPPGERGLFTVTWDTTGHTGTNLLSVLVDADNRIVESSEDNNDATIPVFVAQNGNLTVEAFIARESYSVDEEVGITVEIRNPGPPQEGTLKVSIEDEAGALVAGFGEITLPVLSYAETRNYALSWNTGTTRAGTYRVHAEILQEGALKNEDTSSFTILPEVIVIAQLVSTQSTFTLPEPVAVTATMESQSRNAVLTGLKAVVRFYTATTLLQTVEQTLPDLSGDGKTSFTASWTPQAAGTYTVVLEVTDAAGLLLADPTITVTVVAPLPDAAALKGTLAVSPRTVFGGEPASVSYTLSHTGTVAIGPLDVTLLLVNTATQQSVLTLAGDPIGSLAAGGMVSASETLLTAGLPAGSYLVVLQVSFEGAVTPLSSAGFDIQGAPTAPSLNSPADGSETATLNPTLVINNAADPNGDFLMYDFELYADAGLTSRMAAISGIKEGNGVTWLTLLSPLLENTRYWWRARAHDGTSYGDWMAPAGFFVNVENDPPSAPILDSPPEGSQVAVFNPILSVRNAADPDSTGLTYNFVVATDPDLMNIVASVIGVPEGDGITSWVVNQPLQENTIYYWSAQADDWLSTGPYMPAASFFVNTANDPPTAPTPVSPVDGATVTTSQPTLLVGNAADPEGDALFYLFELDTAPTFDSPSLLRSPALEPGADTTLWTPTTILNDNTRYYWRARATDGLSYGPWTATVSFYVNTVNDPPTAPALAAPSDGSEVNTVRPTLAVYPSSDPDNDPLTYEFEVYADAGLTLLVAAQTGVQASLDNVSWTIAVDLTENAVYWWRARASDGIAVSGWMPAASFRVNAVNDAPTAPVLISPADGETLTTPTPALTVANAADPEGDPLSYSFEVYSDAGMTLLVASINNLQEGAAQTAWTVDPPLPADGNYYWRARAHDGTQYGPYMPTASFQLLRPASAIAVELEIEPETLNLKSKGNWIKAEIEFPEGYDARTVDLSSILLNGVVPAERQPAEFCDGEDEDDADDDSEEDEPCDELKVKFNRAQVQSLLTPGDQVKITVTGRIGSVTFEGVDYIRVIQ
jgi:hypothetical protein